MGDAVPETQNMFDPWRFFYRDFYGLHKWLWWLYVCVYIVLLLFTNFVATGSKV